MGWINRLCLEGCSSVGLQEGWTSSPRTEGLKQSPALGEKPERTVTAQCYRLDVCLLSTLPVVLFNQRFFLLFFFPLLFLLFEVCLYEVRDGAS